GSRTYGAPSVKTAWYGRAVHAGRISRQIFWPVPNVDSALVELERHEQPLGTDAERRTVFAVVDAAFAQRRKTLRSALSGWAGSAARSEEILRSAGIPPGGRARPGQDQPVPGRRRRRRTRLPRPGHGVPGRGPLRDDHRRPRRRAEPRDLLRRARGGPVGRDEPRPAGRRAPA